MKHVSLELVKSHINVENSFTDDDAYITSLIEAAEAVVSNDICEDLEDLAQKNGGDVPAGLRQCILLMVGNFYANREPVAFAQCSEVPLAYKHIVSQYRNYSR